MSLLLPALSIVFALAAPAVPASLDQGLAALRTRDLARARAILSSLTGDSSTPPLDAAKARLLLARAETASGRPREALLALAAIDASAVPAHLVDLVAFERAKALADAGDPSAAGALRSFLADWPVSGREDEARLLLARALLAAGDRAGAAEAARAVIAGRPGPGRTASSTLLLARASDEPERTRLLKSVYVSMPDTQAADETGLAEKDLSPEERLERADAFFDAMDWEEAQRLWEAAWAAGDRSPRLARKLALSHLVHVRDDARKSLAYLDEAIRGGAMGEAEGRLYRARAHAKLEDYRAARKIYQEVLASRPRTEDRVRALYYLGWLPYDHGEYDKALPHFDRFLREVKKHELRSYVIWAKAWSLYRLGRHEDALKVFEDMLDLGNCLVAGKAMYWGGRSHRALGHKAESVRWMRMAIERYPLTYYAVLAAKRLHEWDGTPLPDWMTGPAVAVPEPGPLWPFDRLSDALAAKLRQVKDFADVGETARARAAWSAIATEVEAGLSGRDKAAFLSTVAEAVEDFHAPFQRGPAEFGRQMGQVPAAESAPFWMMAYPRAHRTLSQALAGRFGLPEHWIYSIMRQESRYRPAQVSHTAAIGMMQMIPATAKIIGRALGLEFRIDAFFEPGENLLYCTWYLAALLKDFKGQIVFASAAYNSGAPAIKRMMRKHKGRPFDEMVELISYNEGRNYCRKVAEHLIRYARLHVPPAGRAALYAAIFPDRVDYDLGSDVEY